MIDFANKYVDKVNNLLMETSLDIKYKYFYVDNYSKISYEPEKTTWNKMDFVYLDENKEVTGLISVALDRPYPVAKITMIHKGGGFDFIIGVKQIIKKLFVDYKIPKIIWGVLIGNKAEILYDRFVIKNGGKIVGIYHKHVMALDGEICDFKMYEILREDFIEKIEKGEKNG